MKSDLDLRLTQWWQMNYEEHEFFNWLGHTLGYYALKPCKKSANIEVFIHYFPNDEEDDTAYMLGDDDHQFEIHLDKRIPLGMMIDYLIHELAHVHSWEKNEPDDHGPEFGKSYATLYRKYLDLYDMWWG